MRTAILLSAMLCGAVQGAEPPDWYAHIPAEQRAALLAARSAPLTSTAIGGLPVQVYRGPPAALYAAPTAARQFDLTRIGAANLTLADHRLQRARVDDILREYRRQAPPAFTVCSEFRVWDQKNVKIKTCP
jgi:hypothetical protein